MCMTHKLSIISLEMLQQAFSLSFPTIFFIFSLLAVSTADSNVYVQCSQLNLTSMTPYESNVNSLFISLLDSASIHNFNKFENSPQSDGVYGLFQCRGDLSSPNCKDCVASAVSQLKMACPASIGGEIQLEGCFVKYDNTSFFGALDKMEVCRRCGPSIGYNSDVLNRIDGALAHLVGGNGEYFRRGDFGSIEGVAQCVQDLSLSDCRDCLSEACGRLRTECETSTWGDMYLGKCYIRFANQGDDHIANNGDQSSKNDIGKWIGYVLAALFGGSSLTFALTMTFNNFCNDNSTTNNVINNFKKEVDKANEKASSAKTTAEETKKSLRDVEKKTEETNKKIKDVEKKNDEKKKDYPMPQCHPYGPYHPYGSYHPYGPMMPPPPPQPCYHQSTPNSCYYL